MNITNHAKDSLVAQFKDVEGDITLKEYVLNKWENDEIFRRWLFDNSVMPDNWEPLKKEEILFKDFLENLPDIEHVSKDRSKTIMDSLNDELEDHQNKILFSMNGSEIDRIQKPKPLFEADYFVEDDGYPFITYTDADKFDEERSAILNSKIIEVRDGKMVVMENAQMGRFMIECPVPPVPSQNKAEKMKNVSYRLIKLQEPNISGMQYNVQILSDGLSAGNGSFFSDYQSAMKYIIEDRLSRGGYDPTDKAQSLFIDPLFDTTTFVGDREPSYYICDQESLYEEKSSLNSSLYDDWSVLVKRNGPEFPHSENWSIADIPVKNDRVQLMDIVNSSSLEYSDGGYTYIYRSKDNELYLDSEKLDLVKSFPSSAERRDWVLDLVTPLNLHKGEGCLLRYLDHSEVYRFNEDEWKSGVTNLDFLDSRATLVRPINYEIDEHRLEWLREHRPIEKQQPIYEKLIEERTTILLNLNWQDSSTKKVYSRLEKEIDKLESIREGLSEELSGAKNDIFRRDRLKSAYDLQAQYSRINEQYPASVTTDRDRQIVERIKQAERIIKAYNTNIAKRFGEGYLWDQAKVHQIIPNKIYSKSDPQKEKVPNALKSKQSSIVSKCVQMFGPNWKKSTRIDDQIDRKNQENTNRIKR